MHTLSGKSINIPHTASLLMIDQYVLLCSGLTFACIDQFGRRMFTGQQEVKPILQTQIVIYFPHIQTYKASGQTYT